MAKKFSVVFHPSIPQQLLEMLESYFYVVGDHRLLLSLSVEYGEFVRLKAVTPSIDKPWIVSIPSQYVLIVSEVGEGAPPGFRI